MRKIVTILVLTIAFISCEKPSDCVESTGEIVLRDVYIDMPTADDSIKKIYVEKGIELIVSEGPVFKVTIQTGSNLIDDIEVRREGNTLRLKDNTTCNWVREFGQTKIYVTTPHLEEIYSKTDRNISSNGVLHFPNLKLSSLDDNADGLDGAGTGDFFFTVANQQLTAEGNNVSRFFISGTTNQANLQVWAGDTMIDASQLLATNVYVFHRGSNDITIYPIQSLTGVLYSTGNLICKNYPVQTPVIPAYYQGQVIFN